MVQLQVVQPFIHCVCEYQSVCQRQWGDGAAGRIAASLLSLLLSGAINLGSLPAEFGAHELHAHMTAACCACMR